MRALLVVAATYGAACATALAADAPSLAEFIEFKGICEASGAVGIPEGSVGGRFLVVDNENNDLWLYDTEHPEEETADQPIKVNGQKPARNIDLEAATWFHGLAIVSGSLGRNSDGKVRKERQLMLAVDLSRTDDDNEVGMIVGSTDKLLAALATLDDGALAPAIGRNEEGDQDEELAPKDKGINLEGMSAAADKTSIWLGFRNPVPAGLALLARLKNPEDVLLRGDDPDFEDPMTRLDLRARGIRAMDYAAEAGAQFIVAGNPGPGSNFEIYRWVEGEAPVPVDGTAELFARLGDFQPEGIIVDPQGTRLQVFSDDETHCKAGEPSFGSLILSIR